MFVKEQNNIFEDKYRSTSQFGLKENRSGGVYVTSSVRVEVRMNTNMRNTGPKRIKNI